MDYKGYDMKDSDGKLLARITDTPEECQLFCQELPYCIGFTWVGSKKMCHPKNELYVSKKGECYGLGCVSGPRTCGNYELQRLCRKLFHFIAIVIYIVIIQYFL